MKTYNVKGNGTPCRRKAKPSKITRNFSQFKPKDKKQNSKPSTKNTSRGLTKPK